MKERYRVTKGERGKVGEREGELERETGKERKKVLKCSMTVGG